MRQTLNFSWKGFFLAPLMIPVGASALLTLGSPGKSPLFGFALFVFLGSIISYPTMLFLFLPGLFVLSRFVRPRWYSVCLLGFVLGVVVFFPIAWMEYGSSGPDSGPPTGTFFEFLWRSRGDVTNCLFPIAGLVTAAGYWGLGTLARSREHPITNP